ncbi:MAG: hypothetical protein ACKVKF_23365, partial [Rhodobacterales bacterium]
EDAHDQELQGNRLLRSSLRAQNDTRHFGRSLADCAANRAAQTLQVSGETGAIHDAAVHSFVCKHFNQERGFYSRENFKANRAPALAEWCQLGLA